MKGLKGKNQMYKAVKPAQATKPINATDFKPREKVLNKLTREVLK